VWKEKEHAFTILRVDDGSITPPETFVATLNNVHDITAISMTHSDSLFLSAIGSDI
jgi:hypothetical protein